MTESLVPKKLTEFKCESGKTSWNNVQQNPEDISTVCPASRTQPVSCIKNSQLFRANTEAAQEACRLLCPGAEV